MKRLKTIHRDDASKSKIAVAIALCACSCFSLVWGIAMARAARGVILDFKIVYYGARCLVQHHDPYNQNDLLRVYLAEGGEPIPKAAQGYRTQMIVASQMYLPTAAVLIAPFGLLPWPTAYSIWVALTFCGITGSALLMWSVASKFSSGPALYLVSFLLVNSGVLFSGGNPAGLAVSLCIIAAWCFLEDRFVAFGIVCMALSLAIKPHDAGLVWLYFLLAKGGYRKHALKALLVAAAIGIVALAWMQQISPHWLLELQANVRDYAVPGSYNDPGPVANQAIGTGMIIDLQTITSVVRDVPGFYRSAAYLLYAPLLAAWCFLVIRSRASVQSAWVALAAIAPLTMLPVYHRPYDAKLLLMAVPACAMIYSAGKTAGWVSVFLTGMAIVFTSDLPLAMLSTLSRGIHLSSGVGGAAATILLLRPAPIALLLLGAFNLLQYWKSCPGNEKETVPVAGNDLMTANGH